jgi:hypothetical protein
MSLRFSAGATAALEKTSAIPAFATPLAAKTIIATPNMG